MTLKASRLHEQWNRAAEREEKRAYFSQGSIKPEEGLQVDAGIFCDNRK
jgi:hypothetical protein